MLYAADAQHLGGRIRFGPPPLGVLVFREPLRWSLDAPRAVAHERTRDLGAARRQLQDQTATAQYLVVVVRRQHQDAASHHRLGRARRQRPHGTRHGANPLASSGGSRTERTGRWRFSFTALLDRRACYRRPTSLPSPGATPASTVRRVQLVQHPRIALGEELQYTGDTAHAILHRWKTLRHSLQPRDAIQTGHAVLGRLQPQQPLLERPDPGPIPPQHIENRSGADRNNGRRGDQQNARFRHLALLMRSRLLEASTGVERKGVWVPNRATRDCGMAIHLQASSAPEVESSHANRHTA